ncbi:MAG: sulfite exporter TauE/SafE family protein, partial [Hymenobacter sp.]
MPTAFVLPLLCFFAFLAGLIDGMVGGGGLIQLPALLLLLPEVPVPTALGTGTS